MEDLRCSRDSVSVCWVDAIKEKPHDTTLKGRVLSEHHKGFHVGAQRLGAPVHPALDREMGSTELSLTAMSIAY